MKLAELSLGRDFSVHLPAGCYWFHMWEKNSAVHLTVEAGEDYFLRVSPFGGNHFEVVEHDVGELEATETRTIKSKKVLAISAASLNDLQAGLCVSKMKPSP